MRETFGEICSQDEHIDQSESPGAENPTFEEMDHLIGLRLCRMSRATELRSTSSQYLLKIEILLFFLFSLASVVRYRSPACFPSLDISLCRVMRINI